MGRRGKVDAKRIVKGNFREVDKCLDQSDEDYMVDNDEEIEESEEEYVSSAEDESGDSLGEFEEEEEDEVEDEDQFIEKKVKKVGRPRICTEKWNRNRKTKDFVTMRKKKISSRKKTGDDLDEYDGGNKSGITKPAKKKRVSYGQQECVKWDDSQENHLSQRNEALKPRKKRRISYKEEDSGICDDTEDSDDEEFMPDEVDDYVEDEVDDYFDDEDDDDDYIDDEDEVIDFKKNKPLGRPRKQDARNSREQQRWRNSRELKNDKRKRPGNKRTFTKETRHGLDHGTPVKQKKLKITQGQQRLRSISFSDSDFEIEYDYSNSEEEREQVREADKFRGDVKTTLRSSAPVRKALIGQELVQSRMKHSGKKGKEKKDSLKAETGKQVCGICLSEEGKRTVRGTLNCCSHYFCFACIMEWSKVESRCPVCKQRFITVSKSARSNALFHLRTCTIQVPERDQVYQPSEEELRGYLDPYENVICTECHLGGSDALMLLCDICDSPAHTYCVGLGYVVPEGNWYCDGCRPMAVDSLNPRGLIPTLDDRVSNGLSVGSSPMASIREPFDLNEAYVPDTPLSNGNERSSSPRLSPTGSGAHTVRERRRFHHQIRHMVIRRQQDSENNGSIPSASGSRPQVVRGGGVVLEPHHMEFPQRNNIPIPFLGRFEPNTWPTWHNGDSSIARLTPLVRPTTQRQASTSNDGFNRTFLQNEFAGTFFGQQQVQPAGFRPNNEPDIIALPELFGEGTRPSRRLQRSLTYAFLEHGD